MLECNTIKSCCNAPNNRWRRIII